MNETRICIGIPPDFTVRDLGWLWNMASEAFRVEPNEDMTWEGGQLVIDSDDGFDRDDVLEFRRSLRSREWDVAPDFEWDLSWLDATVIPFPQNFTVRDLDWMMDEVGSVVLGAASLRHDGDCDILWSDDRLEVFVEIDRARGRAIRDAFRAHGWDVRPDFEPVFAWLDEGASP